MITRIFIIIVFISFHYSGNSQISTNIEELKNKYPTTNKINLNRELSIDITLENDEILIKQASVEEELFLNETATQFSKESISFSSFNKLEYIEASSFSLSNGNYLENKVIDFREKDELDGAFYDDVKSLNFIYPKLEAGSKTKLQLEESITNPRFLRSFYFGGYYPALNSKLTITVDKDIDITFKEFNLDSLKIDVSKTEKRNKTIYTWQTKNISRYEMEVGTPNFRNYYPHIVPIITQYKNKNNQIIKLLSKTSDLYSWYYSLIKDINQQKIDAQLIKTVHELTADKNTNLDKVRAIYYWVQNNIKYIAFEYALGGFVPREANEIYTKKYGDCKDNSSILYEMLKIANLQGYLTWIGTRSIPYKYHELPTPAVDNHMILTYKDKNNIYFLDATGRYNSLELPSSFIQGKEALLGKDGTDFEIVNVPIIDAKINSEKSFTSLEIDNDILKGSSSISFSGYTKIELFNKLDNLNSEKKFTDYYNTILKKGNNKISIEKIKESNKFDYDKDFIIDYDFKIPNYLLKSQDEMYINLNLDKTLLEYTLEDHRKTDIEIDYKKSYSYTNELVIPQGYTIDYLPENVTLSNDLMTVSINYVKTSQKIIYTHNISFDFLILKLKDQNTYTQLINKIKKAYKELIVLKKVKE